jgi:hypothetical protein
MKEHWKQLAQQDPATGAQDPTAGNVADEGCEANVDPTKSASESGPGPHGDAGDAMLGPGSMGTSTVPDGDNAHSG